MLSHVAKLNRIGQTFEAWTKTFIGRRVLTILRVSFFIGILYLLWQQLGQVGWSDVFSHLPTTPLFYLFWLARYLVLPATETRTYAIIWQRPMGRHFWAFVRKRVYNYGVAGYTGEGFLTLWAQRGLGLTTREALVGVKDGNILSAFTANAVTLILITGALASGMAGQLTAATAYGMAALLGVLALSGVMMVGVMIFRRRLVSIEAGSASGVLAWHSGRQLLQVLLFAGMYAAALPEASLYVWLGFVTIYMTMTRIPFLPNQDLVYFVAALAVSETVGVPSGSIAGLLLCETALTQLANLVFFIGTAQLGRTPQLTARVPTA